MGALPLVPVQAWAATGDVRVSGMQSADFGVWDSSNTATFYLSIVNNTVCVWRDPSGAPDYTATVDDGTIDMTLTLNNGLGADVPFEVRFQESGSSSWDALSENVPKNYNQPDQTAGSNDCSMSGPPGKLEIRIPNTALIGKPPGTYTATVRLTIEGQ